MIYVALALALGGGMAYLLMQQQQARPQKDTPQPMQQPTADASPSPVPFQKKPLPPDAVPGVGWLHGLQALYKRAGIYNGVYFNAKEEVYKSLIAQADSIGSFARGSIMEGALKGVGSILESVALPGKLAGEFWASFNIASMYVEVVGPPPASAWTMLAALSKGQSVRDLSGYSDGENWAPTAGIEIASELLQVFAWLDDRYILPSTVEAWTPEKVRERGLSVVNDGDAFKPSGRYPFAINAHLASYRTAMQTFLPRNDSDRMISAGMNAADHYQNIVTSLQQRERLDNAWWYRFDATDCWYFVWALKRFSRPAPHLDPPEKGAGDMISSQGLVMQSAQASTLLQSAPRRRRSIIPTMISFEVPNAIGALSVSVPETERRRYVMWNTNPGGGWMNTSYPPPSKWNVERAKSAS